MRKSTKPGPNEHSNDHATEHGNGSDAADTTIQRVTGSFTNGNLTIYGDGLANTIEVSRNAAGTLLVNGGAVPIPGGTPTVANTSLIQVLGQAGNDVITLNEANGPLPRAYLFGGSGDDALTGGSGADSLFGQGDNDTLNGRLGVDLLLGGAGNDVLIGGDANDQMFGEAGDDRLVWNPGDDNDLFEGGTGFDTAEINGAGGAEVFSLTANGTRVRFDRIDPSPFFVDAGAMEKFVVNMNGGDDTFSATGNLAALVQVEVDGGTGNDTILGSNGADLLRGGDGNDFVDGQQGADIAQLGSGDDVFQWDPGDGSDVVEGGGDTDTLRFNGSNIGEIIDLAAASDRIRLTRNVGTIVMDANDVERFEVNVLGGADNIHVGDLSATDASEVVINLAAVGGLGDAQVDTVSVDGRAADDVIDVTGNASAMSVIGLPAQVQLRQVEATDALIVSAGAGNDSINAATLAAGQVALTLDGGIGNDTLIGSAGGDQLIGGEGDDVIDGNQGNDTAFMGDGDDVFIWDAGDGSDVVDGQAGVDALVFNGANIGESFEISANADHARLFRDAGSVTMDLNDVERIELDALGGTDNVVVGNLAGTDVQAVEIDLAGEIGGDSGDGQVDRITVVGGAGDDTITVQSSAQAIEVTGLSATLSIAHADAGDQLVINGSSGNDVIDASGLADGIVGLEMFGGLGVDVLTGSSGGDLIVGQDGDDHAFMGAGDDTFVWNPGDDNDTLEGQAGTDTLLFNGANVAETITIFANGDRAAFFRDIAGVTMDTDDLEVIRFTARGGADTINVNDLSSTDVEEVRIDLAGVGTSGDAQLDRVVIDGTGGDDLVVLSLQDGALVIDGLRARVVIEHFDADDVLQINGLGGDDVIDASGLLAGVLDVIADAGQGNDTVLGSAGDDVMNGGDGDDVLLGGAGDDVLDGGPGEDVLFGDAGNDVLLNGEIQFDSVTLSGGLFA